MLEWQKRLKKRDPMQLFAEKGNFSNKKKKPKRYPKSGLGLLRDPGLPTPSYIKPKYPAVTLPGQVGSPEPTGQRWKNVRACEQCWCKKVLARKAKLSCHKTIC